MLQELKKATTGWPAVSTRHEVLKPYLQFKDELLDEDGLILKGDRLITNSPYDESGNDQTNTRGTH